jgi:hypothetical protein
MVDYRHEPLEEQMGFPDKPTPSVEKQEKEGGWLVISRNIDGKPYRERFFNSQAEADGYWLSETGKIKNQ